MKALEDQLDRLGATINERMDALCDEIDSLRAQLATAREEAFELANMAYGCLTGHSALWPPTLEFIARIRAAKSKKAGEL